MKQSILPKIISFYRKVKIKKYVERTNKFNQLISNCDITVEIYLVEINKPIYCYNTKSFIELNKSIQSYDSNCILKFCNWMCLLIGNVNR